jgi:hypothetical protein
MGFSMNDNLHIDRVDTEFLINYLIYTLSLLVQNPNTNIKSGEVVNFPKNIEWVYKKPLSISTNQMSIFEEE